MKLIAPITFFMIVVAMCTTVFFVKALEPTSTKAFLVFSGWLVIPYIIMGAVLLFLQRKGHKKFYLYVSAIIVSACGILFLMDVIYWHPDSQGAIAVLMTPILQGGIFVLLFPLAWWLKRETNS